MINIVLEGPKGSGKSTISDHFVKKGFEYFHSSAETENDFLYHCELLSDRIFDDEKRVIDRFSVGEMIYPSIYERVNKLDWLEFIVTMSHPDTVYVILYSSDIDFLINRIFDRGRETSDENIEFIKKSNDMFKMIGNNFNEKNILLIDVSKTTSEEIIKQIEELEYEI